MNIFRIWLVTVALLFAVALFGSINADPLRAYAPAGTALYVRHGNAARAFLLDGSIFRIQSRNGASAVLPFPLSPLPSPLSFRDPLPNPTPFQNLRIRFAGSYALLQKKPVILSSAKDPKDSSAPRPPSLRSGVAGGAPQNDGVWLFLWPQSDVGVFRGGRSDDRGLPISSLPASLLAWSSKEEPVEILDHKKFLPEALGEGRYGSPENPVLVMLLPKNISLELLKRITQQQNPERSRFALPDSTLATELIAPSENPAVKEIATRLGKVITIEGDLKGGSLPGVTSANDARLLSMDIEELVATETLTTPGCPIQKITSYQKSPLFVIGADAKQHLVICTAE